MNFIYNYLETNYFIILVVQVSRATYDKEYVRKSIQTIYSRSKYTFKLRKPVKIYKVHHYEIVLVSLWWIEINSSTTHKYTPVNDETYQ